MPLPFPGKMNRAAWRFRAALLLLTLASTACAGGGADGGAASGRSRPAVVGEAAPTYAIATVSGDSLVVGPSESLVLLNVWATWCASCKEEFALMDTLLAKHGPSGLRVVAVSVDAGSVEPVLRVAEQYQVTFEIAHDPDGEVERRFPALGVPASYLIGRDGRVVWKHVGVLPPKVDSVISATLAKPAASS